MAKKSISLKIEKIFFYLLLFCLPFQTRFIIGQWGNIFNEWTSAYLYLTDILLVGLIVFWFYRIFKKRKLKADNFRLEIILGLFFLAAIISLKAALNRSLGIYGLIKLLEFILLFFYLKYNFTKLYSFVNLARVIVASIFFQSIIAILQFIKQKSLGLRWLGESPLGPQIAGVAKIVFEGKKFIRPYGTFPHPALLATFLVLALFCLFYLFSRSNEFYRFKLFLMGLFLLILFLSFARIITIFGLVSIFIYLIFGIKDKKLLLQFAIYSLLFIVIFWSMLAGRYQIKNITQDEAFQDRIYYLKEGIYDWATSPYIGIGINNFVWFFQQRPDDAGQAGLFIFPVWFYQPIHNIYLMVIVELGAYGLFFFLWFLFEIYRKRIWQIRKGNRNLFILFLCLISCFLLTGLFDHFFWTLQQGQLMFWSVLGVISGIAADYYTISPHSSTDRAQASGA